MSRTNALNRSKFLLHFTQSHFILTNHLIQEPCPVYPVNFEEGLLDVYSRRKVFSPKKEFFHYDPDPNV